DVHAIAHDVVQASAGLAHAPGGDLHDRVHLGGGIARAADVALAVERGRARLEHRVADAERAGIVGHLLELAAGLHVDAAWGVHGRGLYPLRDIDARVGAGVASAYERRAYAHAGGRARNTTG